MAPDNVVEAKRDSSSSDDEHRRFKIAIRHVATIDLDAVMKYCKADQGVPEQEERCMTGVCYWSERPSTD